MHCMLGNVLSVSDIVLDICFFGIVEKIFDTFNFKMGHTPHFILEYHLNYS